MLEGKRGWPPVCLETLNPSILKSIQDIRFKQGRKKTFLLTRNSGNYSNKREKLYGCFDDSRNYAYGILLIKTIR